MLHAQNPSVSTSTQLLTIPQAATQLGVTRFYMYDRIKEGTLPFVQLGTPTASKLRIRQQDLDDFIEARAGLGTHQE